MHLFAHNGVEHATTTEAAGHNFTQVVLTFLLVSIVVFGLMALSVYLIKRFTAVPVESNEKEK